MQKHVNLVDLVKSFPTNIYLQNLASIQKRTSLVKFAHLAETSANGSVSNLSTKVYGTLPATVEAYDDKGNPEMKYGKVRRNTCLWDPFGQIFALGGFGNLPGDTDVWQRGQTRPVAPTFTASCSVEHSWGLCFFLNPR